MSTQLVEHFVSVWNQDAQSTVRLLKVLPVAQYDFRPDTGGRSIGELAWHLAEIDAYISFGIETGKFEFDTKPPGIERPRTIEALAPGYERVHADAVARVRRLTDADLERHIPFFDGKPMKVADLLREAVLHHVVHHRGQLVLMCRLAGGVPPGIYGPTREEMAALKAKA